MQKEVQYELENRNDHKKASRNYWLISTYKIAQGKEEDTLSALEKMCSHAVAYDHFYENERDKRFSSALTSLLSFPENGDERGHTDCYYMMDRLNSTRYDAIRNHPRFDAVRTALKEYAK